MDADEEEIERQLADAEVQEVVRSGRDLREYALQLESELKQAESTSVRDHLKQADNIATLHKQINHCDGVLEKMEAMLLSFQVNDFHVL